MNVLVRTLEDDATMKIEREGHTDHKASDASNENLSENRAESVVNYLIEQGVNRSRLTFKVMVNPHQ